MKLSILILTQNRPKLFTRAIKSAIENRPDDVEIIVNNDSNDITELCYDNVTYQYECDEDISKIYQSLFDHATGDYVYFLEDDDYLLPNFYDNIDYKHDIYFLEYLSKPEIETNGIVVSLNQSKVNRQFKDLILPEFTNAIDYEHFQLGQILFKRKLIDCFPTGNILHNDKNLFLEATKNASGFKYIEKPMWVQTLDGNDNISYPDLNTDTRFTIL